MYDGTCQPAPPGYYVPMAGSGIYYACAPGSYASSSGASSCDIIPVGHYSPFSAATGPYDECSVAILEGAVTCVVDAYFYEPRK